MELFALPALADNYIWMLHNGHSAIVVDPGEAAPVERALKAHALKLIGILITHHHADHTGGIAGLLPYLDGPVIGPAQEEIPHKTQSVQDNDRVQILGLDWRVLFVPGHTAGHVAYFCPTVATAVSLVNGAAQQVFAPFSDDPILFSGDTLFSGGCGRLFEGTPEQMTQSLQKIATLPAATRLCCGHEYTLANLDFAQAVEPSNAAIRLHTQTCQQQRAAGLPTLPSTLGLEQSINPFLRSVEPHPSSELLQSARQHGAQHANPVAVFAALRQWKDKYR